MKDIARFKSILEIVPVDILNVISSNMIKYVIIASQK